MDHVAEKEHRAEKIKKLFNSIKHMQYAVYSMHGMPNHSVLKILIKSDKLNFYVTFYYIEEFSLLNKEIADDFALSVLKEKDGVYHFRLGKSEVKCKNIVLLDYNNDIMSDY
jgi:hypothetical protein